MDKPCLTELHDNTYSDEVTKQLWIVEIHPNNPLKFMNIIEYFIKLN